MNIRPRCESEREDLYEIHDRYKYLDLNRRLDTRLNKTLKCESECDKILDIEMPLSEFRKKLMMKKVA